MRVINHKRMRRGQEGGGKEGLAWDDQSDERNECYRQTEPGDKHLWLLGEGRIRGDAIKTECLLCHADGMDR